MEENDQHRISLTDLAQRLQCSGEGLTQAEANLRLKHYGANVLKVARETPEIVKFLRQFNNFFVYLMLAGAALAFLANHLQANQENFFIGFALLAVVLINALFTYIQEFQSERIMESFRNMMPNNMTVWRDGALKQIDAKFIVPGDVIQLKEGDRVPADGRLIEVNQLKVDHSPLTGESEPQLRKLACSHQHLLESRNMVFSGTLVQSGNGRALVYATGMHTQIGRIAQMTKEIEPVATPIRKELKHFIQIISVIAIAMGGLFFLASLLVGKPLLSSLVFAIGIIVANVPEGLLPTVTLALSMASKRMAAKNALIRNLEAVETLGSTNVVCTDKTGTITQNKMKVTTLVLNNFEWSAYQADLVHAPGFEEAWTVMTLCNNARLSGKSFQGDPTEGALLQFARQLRPFQTLFEKLPRVHESPFDSSNKRMISSHVDSTNVYWHYMKGAPEIVFEKCSLCWQASGISEFDASFRHSVEDIYQRLAARGERVLALAMKSSPSKTIREEHFVFIGLVGMIDPPRPEIADAIDKCRSAGIRIFMITGDYQVTAEALARQVGLFSGDGQVILGSQIETLSEAELSAILDQRELVFARTTPLHKLKIVKALQKKGEIVTVTGDGVNDAPALKNADMGVAMGLSGTEVAKEAANIVLLDDNFATIVSAIEEGRTIYANIKKFVAYALSHTMPEMMPFIAFIALGAPLALTFLLILCVDLGTDMLPSLGLGKELPEKDVMTQMPRKREERLLTQAILVRSYLVVGLLETVAGFFAFFVVLYQSGWVWGQAITESDLAYKTAVTSYFAAVVVCQTVNVMICRTHLQSIISTRFFSNPIIWLGIVIEWALVFALSEIEFLQAVFATAPIGWFEISLALPFALALLLADECRRWLLRQENAFAQRWLTW